MGMARPGGATGIGLVLAGLLWLPSRAMAQALVAGATDSAHAVATACTVVLALSESADRYRCRVEAYQETPTEFVVRVHEQALAGARPPVYAHSVVRLSKVEPSVTVLRVPQL
jgi:hypothetical protein